MWRELRSNLRLVLRGRCGLVAVALLLTAGCAGAGATPTPRAAFSSTPAADAGGPTPAQGGSPMAVLGTENFYADLLAQIGGSRVQATSLLNNPNADPHAFESSPRNAAAVADARLVIVNGLGYDAFMDRLLGASPNPARIVIDVQQLLGLGEGLNVHIWYDPSTMPRVAAAAADALARLEPANAAYFEAREQAYVASLKALDERIAALKARYAGTPIAFTENVAGYLTDAIGLVVKTPIGFMKAVEQGVDPAPADVAALRDLLSGRAVRVLLYNSQVTSPATQQIRDLAEEAGIPIVGVAETIPADYGTFAEWQLGQLDALGRALAEGG